MLISRRQPQTALSVTSPSLLPPAPAVVQLEGGPITLASLEDVERRQAALIERAKALRAQTVQLKADAALKARQGAAFLVAQRANWDASPFGPQLSAIDSLTTQIDQVDAQLSEVTSRARQGMWGLFQRFGDRQEREQLKRQRDQLAAEVAAALEDLAGRVPEQTFTAADALLAPARQALAQAATTEGELGDVESAIKETSGEIARRREAVNKLGFDALWTAAWLRNHEPPPVDSPVTLQKGELAWVTVGSVLAAVDQDAMDRQ